MTRRALLFGCALLAACGPDGPDPADEFREASPSRQELKIAAPSSGARALVPEEIGSSRQALGQTAELYNATVEVTLAVNGSMAVVLNLCEDVIKHPATTVDGNRAVWGPFTDALSPDTFRFTVTRFGPSYEYALETRPKASSAEADFKAFLTGTHTPGAAARQGKGAFTVDWDAAQGMGRKPREVGKGSWQYARDASAHVTIGAQFRQIRDNDSGQLVDADYAYAREPSGAGAFDFVLLKDIHDKGGLKERMAVHSRWTDQGAGRGDVRFSGGDLPHEVTASECWSTAFVRTWYRDSIGMAPAEGDDGTCAFATAEYSTL